MRAFRGAVLLGIAVGLAACGAAPPDTVELTILSINDFHGALESNAREPGAAWLAAALARERATNPRGAVVVDAGDMLQGTALSNLTHGRSTIEFLNTLGLDAAAIGNHEFDWGVPVLVDRIREARFPLLAANVRERATDRRPGWAKSHVIVERQGVRVALIGLITPATPRATLPSHVAALRFLDPGPEASALIRKLVPAEADLAVLVCHLGGTQRGDGPIVGDVADLARDVGGEAAIVAGHSHQLLAGKVGDTPIVQAQAGGRYVGRIDLTFDRAARRVTRSTVQVVPVDADRGAPDARVAALVARHRAAIGPRLDEIVGHAAGPFAVERAECPIGNLVTDVMRARSGADVALTNPGGLRAPLDAGPILWAELYAVVPFDNTIVVTTRTGAEVLELLERAAARGSFLHPSGLRYEIDLARQSGRRVTRATTTDGRPLAPEAKYRVAVNSYMAEGGDGLPLGERTRGEDTGIVVRDALVDHVRAEARAGRDIEPKVDGRFRRTEP